MMIKRTQLLALSIMSALFLSALPMTSAQAQQSSRGQINGVVKDQSGAVVSGARVTLLNAQQAVYGTTESDAQGHFSFPDTPVGTYVVETTRKDFASRRVSARVSAGVTTDVTTVLEIIPITDAVTVTADTGQAQDRDRVVQQVNVVNEDQIRLRSTAVLAQVADEEVGVSLQRTSPTMGEIFVRGLTGKNVAVYVDGVRYTTSTQRGGVSTFFNLNEQSNLRAVEILRGPNSAQYGSDSLGGTVQLVSRVPAFGTDTPEFHGEFNTFFSSADVAFGGNTLFTYGTRHFGFLANIAGRRVNTLRTADGIDTHSAITRFLGLPSDILYTRMPDTAFTQYGGLFRMNYAPTTNQQLILHYQRSQQDGGKRFDQLLGGDGNLIADLRNLMGDFFYARYLKQGLGFFDTGSFTFSINSQREERRNQGGQGNPFGDITHQYERTTAYGFNFYLDKQLTRRNTFLVGGDLYYEGVSAPAHTLNPVTGVDLPSRGRVPNDARYLTYGVYVQDSWDAIPERLRLSGALRYNVAAYTARAADQDPLVRPSFRDDSLRVADFSGRIGAIVTPARGLSVVFNYSRGFRAPNITDLGTLGLTGDGFEVDFAAANALGGIIGTTANDQAVSTGIPVQQQRSEISNNFDLGVRFHRGRIRTEVTGFLIDINDAIVKQALILPPGAVGKFIGDQQIINQTAGGAVFVPLSTTPVLARVNFTNARLFGFESTLEARINADWTFNGNFTYIRAKDKETGLPPNIEGGTPPPLAFLSLRYAPVGKRYWVEGYTTLADRQSRLSSLDLSDRRTGATRTRTQIQNFFRRGACVHGLTTPGTTGVCGSNGGILIATGETQLQVQNRLLGTDPTIMSAPLFTYLPGYGLFNVRGGYELNENSEFTFDFENITDQRYRNPSWGIDGPGRGLTLRYQYKF